eukprot:4202555-Prymnesium_polylepis.1
MQLRLECAVLDADRARRDHVRARRLRAAPAAAKTGLRARPELGVVDARREAEQRREREQPESSRHAGPTLGRHASQAAPPPPGGRWPMADALVSRRRGLSRPRRGHVEAG